MVELLPQKVSSFKEFSIPLNRPSTAGNEFQYIAAALESGKVSGDGLFTKKCQKLLEELTQTSKCLLTTSCTHALEMSALLLDIVPGDEVIAPSFAFVSTINAFVMRGAVPVFADIRPDTLNIDETKLEALITPKTKAIVPIHYAGVGCEMDAINALASEHAISVIEDNAHGLLGQYKNKPLGSFGRLSTLSFHETKNFQCGEGGALLINDETLIERAEIIWEKGTNRRNFFRGNVDKYTWIDLGSSYLPSDLLAAFLYAQLEQKNEIMRKRKLIWNKYHAALADWASINEVQLPQIPAWCDQTFYTYYLIMPSAQTRENFIEKLARKGIFSTFHYLPLHKSPMGLKLGGDRYHCPVTDYVSEQLVRLPLYTSLSDEDQNRIIETILS